MNSRIHHNAVVRLVLTIAILALGIECGAADVLPFPNIASVVGTVLEQRYYDHSRFHPRLMVERAIQKLDRAEIGINVVWKNDVMVLNTLGKRTLIRTSDPSDVASAMRILDALLVEIEKNLNVNANRNRELAYILINGALSTLDPHTTLLSPETSREWSESTIQGQFYGIGAILSHDEGLISIQHVLPGLPAERAGVENGDIVIAIDGEKTAGLTLGQAVQRIKGPKGTVVNLTLIRNAAKLPIELPINRDLVKVISLRHYRDGAVGYVRMDDFNANTAHDLYSALSELNRDNPMKALVLDLRYNGGGLLDQAKLIAGLFLARKQEVVRTTTSDGKVDIMINGARRICSAPMIVMTSPGTASAAEIVSGALQLNDRAIVAGETTFGKGSVQEIPQLCDGSRLKLTIQEYLLPGGASIQDVGVSPDLLLVRHSVREDGRIDLCDMSVERERDNEFALGNHMNYKRQPVAELSWLDPWLDRDARRAHSISSREFHPDRQSMVLIDLLKAACAADDWDAGATEALGDEKLRTFLLKRLAIPLAVQAEIEASTLAAFLGRQPNPVAWGSGVAPATGVLTVTWSGPLGVTAGETVALTVRVANSGSTEAGRLFAIIRADPQSPFWEEEFVIGTVPAGDSRSGILHFRVPPRLQAGEERFTVELYQEGRKQPLASCPVSLRIFPRPSPYLGLSWKVVDDNGDGMLSTDECADLVVEVFNQGNDQLETGVVWVEKENDPYVSLESSRFVIESPIAPGASRSFRFPITVHKEVRLRGQRIPMTVDRIKLTIAAVETLPEGVDARFSAAIRAGIEIPIDRPLKTHRLVKPRIMVREPLINGTRTRLSYHIADIADEPTCDPLDLVALFHGQDKVDLQVANSLDGPVEGCWGYTPSVTLTPGLNVLRLLVRDIDGVISESTLRLWGPNALDVGKP